MLISEIKNDAGILQQVRIFIDQLRAPFGFLKREIAATENKIKQQELIDAKDESKPDHRYHA